MRKTCGERERAGRGWVPDLECRPAPGALPGSHLGHLLWVLRRLAEDLLEVVLVSGEKVSGLGVRTAQRRVEAVLDLFLEGGAHGAALDETNTGEPKA